MDRSEIIPDLTEPCNFGELWIDGSSVLRSGIALNYRALLSHPSVTAVKATSLTSRYYDSVPPQPGKTNDHELLEWQVEEQQRAQEAGLDLQLSPVWSERLRCLFCSCLNSVQFPAPALLDLLGDLGAPGQGPVLLLSHNPALLFSLSKTRKGAPSLLQQVRLLALGDSLEQLDYRAWPQVQQSAIKAACALALVIDPEDVEY